MDIKFIALWVSILLVTVPCIAFGIKKLRFDADKVAQFKQWGYSSSFMVALTLTELFACACMFFPVSRIYGCGIWAIVLMGAIATHLRAKDAISSVFAPIFVGVLVALVYFLGS
jgi:hypothetical protein